LNRGRIYFYRHFQAPLLWLHMLLYNGLHKSRHPTTNR
jgi:hypothetical protein